MFLLHSKILNKLMHTQQDSQNEYLTQCFAGVILYLMTPPYLLSPTHARIHK